MQIIDEILNYLKENELNVQKISKESGISADRIYSWKRERGKPKLEDSEKLIKWWKDFGINAKSNTASEPTPPYNRFNVKMNRKFDPIPYHDIDIAAASSKDLELYDDKNPLSQDHYYIPEFSGCRAFNCFSDSMDPLIKKGSKIFARKLDNWHEFIEFGQVYAVGMTDGRRFLKYIKKGHRKDRFLLVSENKHYEDFEVPFHLIRSIWLIDGSMDKMTQSTFFVLKYPNNNHVIHQEPIIDFGKHEGKRYSEVPHSYWRWLYDKHLRGETVDKDLLDYIEKEVPDIKHQADKNKEQ